MISQTEDVQKFYYTEYLFLQKNVHSDKFVVYLCSEVLPVLGQLSSEDVQLDVLKLLAELTAFCGGEVEGLDSHLKEIHSQLIVSQTDLGQILSEVLQNMIKHNNNSNKEIVFTKF